MKKLVCATVVTLASAPALHAGPIEAACKNSDRPATAALCGCIQQAADITLRHSDQRRAARFFSDPHKAQEVRQSSSDRDNAFWDRYQNFGETAVAMCGD
ncbi:hypothetical protein [Acidimangrovimonas pyrenivorans]|uniref:Secreted protein n=1 Tax=Acidimangrovimonas pyrenivorans TaxID=2030798 RepID=A0ABV7ABS2_9RHOB